MDIHGTSFEKLLEIASSLEEPRELKAMVEALDRMEKNLALMRQRLTGKLSQTEQARDEDQREKRQKLKESLQVLTPDTGRDPEA